MNKVILSGRISRGFEVKYSSGSNPVAILKISIAVSRRFKKDNEPTADFINCIAFGKTAEFISKYFQKGKMIVIVGEIRTNSWSDENGNKKYSTEVLIGEVEFCGSKEHNKVDNQEDTSEYIDETDVDEDAMPF